MVIPYKQSYDIGIVGDCLRITMNVFITDNSNKTMSEYITSQYMVNGTKYCKLKPHPYLSLNIIDKTKVEKYDPGDHVTLNQFYLFNFYNSMKELMDDVLKESSNLWTTVRKVDESGDAQVLNKELAESITRKISSGPSGKTLVLTPCTIAADGDDFQGFSFLINSIDHQIGLSYLEYKYFIHLIKHALDNWSPIVLNMINHFILLHPDIKYVEEENILVVTEEKEELPDSSPPPKGQGLVPDI